MKKFIIKKIQFKTKPKIKFKVKQIKQKKVKTTLININAQRIAETMCIKAITKHPGSAVAWYLICSYLYYIRNISIVSDTFFDTWIVKQLQKHWDKIEHPHKKIIGESCDDIFSAYQIKEKDYPLMTKLAAGDLVSKVFEGRL